MGVVDDFANWGDVHEVLIASKWVPVVVGSYWEGDSAKYGTPTDPRHKQAGWTEAATGAQVIVRLTAVRGVKFNTLRGKLEGG